jgi:PAS domain S-box-containing protein
MNDSGFFQRAGASASAPAPVIGLREVLEMAPDLVFCCDAAGRFAWASPAFETLTGHRASDLVGTPAIRLVPAEERGHVSRHFWKQLRRHQATSERTLTLLRADGAPVTLELRTRLYERVDGDTFVVGIAREARERVPAPALHALAGADAMLNPLPSPTMIMQMPKGSPLEVVRLETKVAELSDMLAATQADLARVPELEAHLADARRQAERAGGLEAELAALREQLAARPSGDGDAWAARAIQAERRAALAEEAAEAARAGQPDTQRTLERVVELEQALIRARGEADAARRALDDVARPMDDDDRARELEERLVQSRHDAAIAREMAEQWELRARDLERDLDAVRAAHGTTADASALESRVAQLETERDQAITQARSKGEFLSVMSHEIRTPLHGVIGMSHLLLEGPLSAEQRQRAEVLHRSSQQLLSLLNDTLDYSRLEAGRLDLEEIGFDLRSAMDQAAALLQPMAVQKGLTFDWRVDPTVPSHVKGDPGRLRQVLLNLASNAIKFTESGRVSIAVDRESEDDDRVWATFRVVDTGIGMAPDHQSELFEAFRQADPSISRRFGGSGLGLAISRRLVERMGGTMGVDSLEGAGSTFWFRLSFLKQTSLPVPIEHTEPAPLRGLRVLVADPSASVREAADDVLRAWGCTTEQAENGPDALRHVREAAAAGQPFAAAVLDGQLDGLDAHELAQVVAGDPDLAATHLVLAATLGRPGDAQKAREAGFAAYLLKPLDWSILHDAIAAVTSPRYQAMAPGDRPLVTRHTLAEARRSRVRILLVEDDPVNQLVTTSALKRVGYHVEVANSGRRALELTDEHAWDLILMDVQMPDMDGCRATAAIRARERGHRTPIVALTGDAHRPSERDRCMTAGMDDVLGKPVDLALLAATVERWTAAIENRGAEAVEMAAVSPHPAPPKLTVVTTRPQVNAIVESPPSRVVLALPEVPEGPAIDVEQLNSSCMGLAALRTSMLHAFLGDIRPRLQRLVIALEANDPRRVEFEAHGLRGMCGTIGARGCALLFGELEKRARMERLGDVRTMMPMTEAEVARAEEFVRRLDSIVLRDAA